MRPDAKLEMHVPGRLKRALVMPLIPPAEHLKGCVTATGVADIRIKE